MWRAAILVGVLASFTASAASAATVGLRQAVTGATSISANPGDTLTLELFLDTDGLSLEGYYLGVDFTGGAVSIQSVTHQPLTGLFPDIFGVPEIDNAAYTIRRALRLDPSLVEGEVDKHEFYEDPAEFDRQLAVLEQYVLDHNTDGDARLVLATNYLFGQRPAAAVDQLEGPFSAALQADDAGALILAPRRCSPLCASASLLSGEPAQPAPQVPSDPLDPAPPDPPDGRLDLVLHLRRDLVEDLVREAHDLREGPEGHRNPTAVSQLG